MALTRKQLSLVHVAKAQLSLKDDDYREILRHVGGVDSAAELDNFGFDFVMQYMARRGFQFRGDAPRFGLRAGMASPGQVALIRTLWQEYTAGEGDDLTLGKWLGHSFQVSALRFLTADQAKKVIAALKAMKARRAVKTATV